MPLILKRLLCNGGISCPVTVQIVIRVFSRSQPAVLLLLRREGDAKNRCRLGRLRRQIQNLLHVINDTYFCSSAY